jgi:hypothetical protein
MPDARSVLDAFGRRHRLHLLEALPWVAAVAAYFAFPDYLALGSSPSSSSRSRSTWCSAMPAS